MDRKIKHGLSTRLLIAIIFGILGIVYLAISIPMLVADSFSSVFVIPMIFGVLGFILLAVAAVLCFFELRKRRQVERMFQENRYLWGEVVEIRQNLSIRINSRHPYVVTVRCQDRSGQLHTFRSRNILHYVDRAIMGKQVKVYYMDESYAVYYVDIDPLLPGIISH
jgi:predicted membrane chloride channel (bestrophin family)